MNQDKLSKTPFVFVKNGLCALSIAVGAILAGGCDSGPTGSSASAPATEEARISGNVQDIHGPIMEGKIEVKDKDGQTVLTSALNGSSNHYSITVPAGTRYPILLIATPVEGTNSQKVRAVVTSPLADRMDITDITTLVVDAAEQLGGLTPENIAKASGGAIGLRQRQGVSAGAGGGGAGAGQSGGGVSRGGHGGHDMSKMGGATGTDSTGQPQPMPGMQH